MKDAIEDAFINGKDSITTDALIASRNKITPIKVSLKEKIVVIAGYLPATILRAVRCRKKEDGENR